jgi:hypothetical protein
MAVTFNSVAVDYIIEFGRRRSDDGVVVGKLKTEPLLWDSSGSFLKSPNCFQFAFFFALTVEFCHSELLFHLFGFGFGNFSDVFESANVLALLRETSQIFFTD